MKTRHFCGMGLVGSLWNRDTQARLQHIHRRASRRAGERPSTRRSKPTFKRRRNGQIRDAIAAVLAEQPRGLRMMDIASAVAARLGEPVPPSTIKSCLSREALGTSGAFERLGRGRYRLRSKAP
jgi:hypothetical protein